MKQSVRVWQKGLLWLWIALVAGCAASPPVSPDMKLETALERIAAAVLRDDKITATVNIAVTTDQGHYPLRAALLLQKPAYLRLERLPLIGTPDFFLAATPASLKIFLPSRGEYYRGKPTAQNIARFLPWSLEIKDIVVILSGAAPLTPDDEIVETAVDQGDWRVCLKTPSGHLRSIWIDQEGRPVKFVQNGMDGRVMYSVCYQDYEAKKPLPGKIIIETAQPATRVVVSYTDARIERPEDVSVFDLPVPPGVAIISLD